MSLDSTGETEVETGREAQEKKTDEETTVSEVGSAMQQQHEFDKRKEEVRVVSSYLPRPAGERLSSEPTSSHSSQSQSLQDSEGNLSQQKRLSITFYLGSVCRK